MINAIIRFSIRNKLLIGLFIAVWIGIGIWSMWRVPIDAVPDITNNQVQIITQAPNLSAEEIEQYVTYPIELAMGNLPGLIEIRSISRFGLSVVTVVFEDDMGTYLPRQLVSEKLSEVRDQIPEGFGEPYIGPISTGLGEIYQYVLAVDSAYRDLYSLQDLRTIQDWIVSRQMVMVPGVVEVNSIGGKIKQYEVEVDPEQLNALGLTISDIFYALKRNNQNTGGAYIEKNRQAHFIRGQGLVRSLEEIGDILVKKEGQTPIYIRDVARLRFGSQVRYGALTKDGRGEAVGGIIMMLKGANSNDVIRRVEERLDEIEKTLPEGIHIEPVLNRSKLIQNTISTVVKNLLEGAAIVILILIVLLGNWRAGVIVASTIPLSLLFAFALMRQFGIWANLMSLGAIDFGIIVDGAVIIVEGAVFLFHRHLLKGMAITPDLRDKISYQAAGNMMNAAFFGQLIILIVFVPVLALEGVEGKMFKPMAYTFMFAMIGVMILCLTYVPMMTAWFLRPSHNEGNTWGDHIVAWLENQYEPALRWSLKHGKWILGSALLAVIIALWIFERMGGEFMPRLDEGDIAYNLIMRPGTSLSETIRATTKAERMILDSFPEVISVMSRIGVSEVPNDPMPFDFADVIVTLRPSDEWTSAETKEELVNKMKRVLSHLPGVAFSFSQPIENRFNELLEGVREDIAIKIYGEDIDLLAQKAQEVARIIAGTPGIGDIRVEATTGLPQIVIRYDRRKLAQYGLSVEDLNQAVATAFGGGEAGVVFEGEKRFALVVRLQPEYRQNIDHVKDLWILLPDGSRIPLREVAHIQYKPGPMQVSRDNTHRRVYVGVNVRGRDIESLVDEIRQKLDEQLQLPPGYYIQYGGAFENLQRAVARLKILLPVALGLIFVLIFLALRSFSHTMMIYMAIPLATIGGVFSLWLRDMPFSVSAGIGFIVLFGVAVLNGLVLINGWNALKKEGNLNINQRVIQGARRRVRPILLTALTDIFGFLPMAVATSAGAEVQRPLATVVIGGLVTSTLLTLFVLPILYRKIETAPSWHVRLPKWVGVGILLLLWWPSQGHTQQTLDAPEPVIRPLVELIDSLLASNPAIQQARYNAEAARWAQQQAIAFPKSALSVEYGQYNSYANDLAIYFEQSFEFPTVYAARSRWARDQRIAADQQLVATTTTMKFQLATAWNRLAYHHAQYRTLQAQDSLMTVLMNALQQAHQRGATNRIDLLSAENQRSEIRNRLVATKARIKEAEAEIFRMVAPTRTFRLVPPQLGPLHFPDTSRLRQLATNHPLLTAAQAAEAAAWSKVRMVRQQRLPELTLGVFDIGMQGTDLPAGGVAGPSDRFRGIQAGITWPLLPGGYRAATHIARLEAQMAHWKTRSIQMDIWARTHRLLNLLKSYADIMTYYQQEALPHQQQLMEAALQSFAQGKIDLFRSLNYYSQAFRIQEAYLNALYQFNQLIIESQYLLSEF